MKLVISMLLMSFFSACATTRPQEVSRPAEATAASSRSATTGMEIAVTHQPGQSPGPAAAYRAQSDRYQSSGVPMRLWINDERKDIPFKEYLKVARHALEKYHWKIDGESQAEHQTRIAQIAPHEWQKRKDCTSRQTEGILLVHGLLDSPFLMHDVGDALNKITTKCVLVRSILLPGHGTTPGDLRKVTWEDWLSATKYGIESFHQEASSIHIVGFSTGAALAIYWATNPKNEPLSVPIKSVVLLSPAIRILGLPRIPKPLLDVVAWVRNSADIFAWEGKFEDRDFAKYESIPLNAAYQLYLLDREIAIEKVAHKLKIPVFMALSLDDATVDSRKSVELFSGLSRPENRLFLVVRDSDKQFLSGLSENSRVKLKNGEISSQHIISFSHISFPIKPSNYHYGIDGDYASCLHYSKVPEKFCACKTEQMRPAICARSSGVGNLVFGEISNGNIQRNVILRRLSFNPYFEEMLVDINKFILNFD